MGGRAGAGHYQLSHLEALEAQSVHILREVVAEFERPVLLFSGGKDSVVMLRLAEKAFWPARLPFPIMHVDTGHNFPEVLEFRDRRGARAELDARAATKSSVTDLATEADLASESLIFSALGIALLGIYVIAQAYT